MDEPFADCSFCRKFSQEPAGCEIDPIFDHIVWKNRRFIIIPAMGSLAEGYLLVIPRRHYYSIANLPHKMLLELHSIKSAVRQVLTERFTTPIFFEHGSVCQANRTGSSVDHAHLHCVPFKLDLPTLLASLEALIPESELPPYVRRIERFDEIARQAAANQSYIYFETQDEQKFIISNLLNVPSQCIRIIIAQQLGIPDQWDWAHSPFQEKALSTLRSLESMPIVIQPEK